MKLWVMQQSWNNRRSNSFRANGLLDSGIDNIVKTPSALFWLVLHGLFCLFSLVMGFRFSRLIVFLLFSTSNNNISSITNHLYNTTMPLLPNVAEGLTSETPPSTTTLQNPDTSFNETTHISTGSHIVVGRHGILIRPWPHPDPVQVMKAHRILERVQTGQRLQYGIKNPRPLIVITPTYVRTFQTLHLTGLMHSLMLAPYNLTWIVVEAGGPTTETASLIAKSGCRTIHLGFDQQMPISWEDRHRMEAQMRLHALRVVREQSLDGIVVFCDDSNIHSKEFFDEIQSVKWIGAVSVGILAHSGNPVESSTQKQNDKNSPHMPVQGPACDSDGNLAGWHTFNPLSYAEKSVTYIGDDATVVPRKLEWAGFVLNSRLVWKEAEGKPDWVKDLDTLKRDGGDLENPLSLLSNASFVEPLGSCGRKVLLWWLRVEARADGKFPPGWVIGSPLEITVPAKHTPWSDTSLELPSGEKVGGSQEHMVKHSDKTGRVSKSKHGLRKR